MKQSYFRRPPRLDLTRLPHHFGGSPEEVALALDHLATANRYFGGTRSLLRPFRELLSQHRGHRLRLLDVGCGLADTARALVTWARHAGFDLHVVGVDQDPEVVTHVQTTRAFREIDIVQGNALDLPFAPRSFDYVYSSMLLHYFSFDEAVAVLRAWGALASRAVLVSDVERHWFPCRAIQILSKMSKSGLFREGSRRTVLRGFSPEELLWLAEQAGLARPRVRRYFPFRLTLVAHISSGRDGPSAEPARARQTRP